MLDRDGYRPNVAIVVANHRNLVFWGKRIREHSWQFPQGGINTGETPEAAMYRELREEVGLQPHHAACFALHSEVHGDIPVAAVEVATTDAPDADAITRWARERLGVRAPRRVVVVGALPRNPQGKVSRRELTALVATGDR